MKIFLPLLLLCVAVCGCMNPLLQYNLGHNYEYLYGLKNSANDTAMVFKDDNIEIEFSIDEKRINFSLTNLTSDALKINWDESSLVLFGKAKKVSHVGVKYTDIEKTQIPSVVPPTATLDESIIPAENIKWSGSSWYENELFPTDDYGKEFDEMFYGLLQSTFLLYLPITKKGEQLEYSFEFKIQDILKHPKKEQLLLNERLEREAAKKK